jgi:hypothetical protein
MNTQKERNEIYLVNYPRNYPEDLENNNLPFVSVINPKTNKEVFSSFYAKKYTPYATKRAKQLLLQKISQ